MKAWGIGYDMPWTLQSWRSNPRVGGQHDR